MIPYPFQMVGGQLQRLEPFHEIGAEHLALAIKCIPAQPRAFAPRQAQGADMIQLFTQFTLINQMRKRDARCAIDQ